MRNKNPQVQNGHVSENLSDNFMVVQRDKEHPVGMAKSDKSLQISHPRAASRAKAVGVMLLRSSSSE